MTERSTPDSSEAAFYTAFKHADINAMAEVWMPDGVVCVHPGSKLIMGYSAVIRSWSQIFENAQGMQLQTRLLNKWHSESLAVHVVEEVIPLDNGFSVVVLATNVYAKHDSDWRILEHHASAMGGPEQRHTIQ